MTIPTGFSAHIRSYCESLYRSLTEGNFQEIEILANALISAWSQGQNIYICGNGGSAANAIHLANDFHYGVGACGPEPIIVGLKVEALPANQGVVTCLANDTGYANVFAHQLQVKGKPGDLLIVLSGSGNSPNVVNALEASQKIGMRSFAVVAFDGGQCKQLADHSIHISTADMQIAEDAQLVIGHICMQWLNMNKPLGMRRLTS
jgi:D-sedoheptulose 7-phosphate isomerase